MIKGCLTTAFYSMYFNLKPGLFKPFYSKGILILPFYEMLGISGLKL